MKFTLIDPPSAPHIEITWRFKENRYVRIVESFDGFEHTDPDYVGRISLNKFTASLELRGLTHNDTGDYDVDIFIEDLEVFWRGQTSLTVFGTYTLYNLGLRAHLHMVCLH